VRVAHDMGILRSTVTPEGLHGQQA
jgi:hypothetical protein